MPSEKELVERYGVARNRVRSALALLRDAGLVYTVPGRGAQEAVSSRKSKRPAASQRDTACSSSAPRRRGPNWWMTGSSSPVAVRGPRKSSWNSRSMRCPSRSAEWRHAQKQTPVVIDPNNAAQHQSLARDAAGAERDEKARVCGRHTGLVRSQAGLPVAPGLMGHSYARPRLPATEFY
ncbi:GntR family transcriptional regulator [Streptomyces abikoensis]